jgi:hypothetical protein
LNYSTIVDNHNAIGLAQTRQTMGHDHDALVRTNPIERVLYASLTKRI